MTSVVHLTDTGTGCVAYQNWYITYPVIQALHIARTSTQPQLIVQQASEQLQKWPVGCSIPAKQIVTLFHPPNSGIQDWTRLSADCCSMSRKTHGIVSFQTNRTPPKPLPIRMCHGSNVMQSPRTPRNILFSNTKLPKSTSRCSLVWTISITCPQFPD